LAWDGFIAEEKLLNLLEYMNSIGIETNNEYENELLHDEPYIY